MQCSSRNSSRLLPLIHFGRFDHKSCLRAAPSWSLRTNHGTACSLRALHTASPRLLSDIRKGTAAEAGGTACRVAVHQVQHAIAASPPIPLKPGEVHIWWLKADQVQSETLQEQYMRILPAEERKYVLEGANPRVRKERLLARTLVRVTLARYCQGAISPTLLCFESSPGGKPWLVSEEACTTEAGSLHFNLTHTDELLGVAVARDRLVGLDAEGSSRLTKVDPLKLAARRFSDREFDVLKGFGDQAERARLFMRLWTLKEAYVKATGRGISAAPGLKAFTFELLLQSVLGPQQPLRPSKGRRNQRNLSSDRPSSRANDSMLADQNVGPEQPLQASLTSPSLGLPQAERRLKRKRGVSDLRLPFWIHFRAAEVDGHDWEAMLMEISGGHTAALVVESEASDRIEGGVSTPRALGLKLFQCVPLVSEAEASEHDVRLIGYGRSAANHAGA